MPTLVVWMVTYNHESNIGRAIESVMMQKTSFTFKLFIGEDCSTDSTQSICKQMKEKYPQMIELFLNESNLGGIRNGMQMYYNCYKTDAEYIALLEGDDYWTDPLKLQKQVDLMLSDDSIALSFHNANEIRSDSEMKMISGYKTGFIKPSTVINKKIRIPTLSMLFKTSINLNYEFLLKLRSGDRYLEVAAASAGKIFYIDEVMGVKRTLHTGSLGQWKKDPLKAILEKYKSNVLLLDIVPPHLKKYMHRYLFRICIQILKLRRLSELKFLGLALRHRVLGI